MMVKGFGFSSHERKQGEKGATLIEAALFTVLALGTIIGGIVFFQQASISAKTNEMVRTMASLQTQVRALFQTQATFGTTGINSLLIASNAAPSNILEDSDNDGTMDALVHGFGGSITVTGATRQFTIAMADVPIGVCTRIIPFDESGNGTIGSGIASVTDGTATDTDGITSGSAESFCTTNASSGEVSLTWTFDR